jgi:hypothetical protein
MGTSPVKHETKVKPLGAEKYSPWTLSGPPENIQPDKAGRFPLGENCPTDKTARKMSEQVLIAKIYQPLRNLLPGRRCERKQATATKLSKPSPPLTATRPAVTQAWLSTARRLAPSFRDARPDAARPAPSASGTASRPQAPVADNSSARARPAPRAESNDGRAGRALPPSPPFVEAAAWKPESASFPLAPSCLRSAAASPSGLRPSAWPSSAWTP